MAVAHDSEILGAASTAAGNYDTSITPTNIPNAACITIEAASTSDLVTSAAYGISAGAVTLARRRFDTDTTEAGAVYLYWAAGAFPAGAQTVRVVRTGTANMRVMVSTMTVTDPANFTVAVDSDATGTSASVANPSWTHISLVDNVVAYLAIHSGLNAMTTTPATNWTLQGSQDVTSTGRGYARRTLAAAGSLGAGWTAGTAASFCGSSIAFKEVAITQQQNARAPHVNRRAANRAAIW